MSDPIFTMYQKVQLELVRKLKKYKGPKPLQFNASELSRCKTALYYRLAGFIPAMEAVAMSGYGPDGDMHHDQVRHALKKAGAKVSGVTFNKDGTVKENTSVIITVKNRGMEYKISMRLDGFIHISHRKHVLEVKSLGFWKYKPLAEVWEKTGSEAAVVAWLKENRKDIMYQTHACMVGTGVPRTYLLIKGRDNCLTGLHAGDKIIGGPVINFDKAVWEEALQRLTTVVKHLHLGSPPPPEYIPSSYECMRLCKYRYLCHDAERRRKHALHPAALHPQLGAKTHIDDK